MGCFSKSMISLRVSATFQINIGHLDSKKSISNMPAKSRVFANITTLYRQPHIDNRPLDVHSDANRYSMIDYIVSRGRGSVNSINSGVRSNTDSTNNTYVWEIFHTTPVMSSYLVGMAVFGDNYKN